MTNDKPKTGLNPKLARPLAFRNAIEKAEGQGVSRSDMLLRLTARDVAGLKRDRTVPVEDISFSGGVMRFLGVEVVGGGVAASALEAVPPDAAGAPAAIEL